MDSFLRRRGPAKTMAIGGGLAVLAGILLSVVPLDHGTIPQWNGLCASGIGQLGQLLDTSARQACGMVGVADHLIGWLVGLGVAAVVAGGLLAFYQQGWIPQPPGQPTLPFLSAASTQPAASPAGMGPAQPAGRWRWPAGWHGLRLAVIAVVAGLLAAGGAYAAVSTTQGSAGLASFLCWNGPGDTGATLLQWLAGPVVSGTYRNASVTGTAPGEQVSTGSGALTGTVNGASASLDMGGGPEYGTIGTSLVLQVTQSDGSVQPVTCKPGTTAGWNQALAVLSRQVSTDNSAAAAQQQQQNTNAQITQADQQLTTDIATLTQDATTLETDKTLAGDIQTMRNDLGTGQSDYQVELSDPPSNRCSDASTVGSDASTVDSDLSTLQSDEQNLESNNVSQDISAVQSDTSTVTNLGGSPNPDPATAIAQGKKALSDLAAAIAWASSTGNSIDNQAHQVASQAQSASGC